MAQRKTETKLPSATAMASVVVIIYVREDNSSIQLSSVQIPRQCLLDDIFEELKKNEDIRSLLRSFTSRSSRYTALSTCSQQEVDTDHVEDSCPAFDTSSILKFRPRPRWKSMLIEEILDDVAREETLESAFGPLLDGKFTIEITTRGQRQWTHEAVVQSVKELVKSRSLKELIEGGCPLSQGMLSQIAIGKYISEISRSKRHQYSVWYSRFSAPVNDYPQSHDVTELDRHAPMTKKRRRISFEPMTEISILKAWFDINCKPDEQRMELYARELNTRRRRPGVITADNVKIWFKNERQRRGRHARELETSADSQEHGRGLDSDNSDVQETWTDPTKTDYGSCDEVQKKSAQRSPVAHYSTQQTQIKAEK